MGASTAKNAFWSGHGGLASLYSSSYSRAMTAACRRLGTPLSLTLAALARAHDVSKKASVFRAGRVRQLTRTPPCSALRVLAMSLAQSGSTFESSQLDETQDGLKELSRCEIQNSVAVLEVCWD